MILQVNRAMLLCCCAGWLSGATAAGAGTEGFGWSKKTVNLARVRPAQVFISGTRIAVRVTSQDSSSQLLAARLQAQMESQLIANDRRLTTDSVHPQTIIEAAILQNTYDEKTEYRAPSTNIVGSVLSALISKKDNSSKQDDAPVPYKVIRHEFSVAYKIYEPYAGRSLIADTIPWKFSNAYENGRGAPDKQAVESQAVTAISTALSAQVTPTKESVGVLLPKGSFESAAGYAEAGLWNKYLETLQKMPVRQNRADESYRQYAMGVAYEALGYGAEDHETTLRYLEQASVHYNSAIDANPKEEYFRKPYQPLLLPGGSAKSPTERVQEALIQYQKLKEFSDTLSAAASTGSGAKALPTASVTNSSIVEMVHANVPEDVILTSIDTAPSVDFDVTPRGLIQLSEAGASKKVIQHIQAAASRPRSTPTTEKAKSPKSSKSNAKKE